MIKVLIVDDQKILRDGLAMILDYEEDIQVVKTAKNGEEAIAYTKLYQPDVILMDIRMPVKDGIQAIEEIKKMHFGGEIIILTTFKDEDYVYRGMSLGASGYILKDSPPEKIIEGIHTVMAGGALIEPEIAKVMIQQFTSQKGKGLDSDRYKFTQRELQIIHYVGRGMNNKEICNVLYISEGTVKNHITKILQKTDLRDRTQLAIFSIKNDV